MSEGLLNHILNTTGGRVFSGPFAGMRIAVDSSWGRLDLPSRLLGCYEEELHDFFLRGRARNYSAVVDIGCADGFYAVGMAMLYPDVHVYAFDINEAAQSLTMHNARLNHVEERITVGGVCDIRQLASLAKNSRSMLVLSDCEGYEVDLFSDPMVRQDLQSADLIIECHDFIRPGCTNLLRESLALTHDIKYVEAGQRDPNVFPMLRGIGETDRWLSVCEYRPCTMNWLVGSARR